MVDQTLVIDGANHLIGRLASVVAKQLLSGKKVVVVRCEQLIKSGSYKRMVGIFKQYLRKRICVNHKKGPHHQKAPSKMFIKVVRGMLPCRTERGKLALKNLTAYEGVPMRYSRVKRMIVPGCTRVICLKPASRCEKLERLAAAYGWKYKDIVAKLEAKRKEKSSQYYKKKIAENKHRSDVAKSSACSSKLEQINAQLRRLGQLV